MDKVRVALVGCGRVSVVHADALAKIPEAELVLAVDSRPERAKEMAGQYGCAWATDFGAALREGVDAVQLCTPHYLHAPMAIAAAQAGKHVLTEKPMAIKADDAYAMIRAAEANRVKLGVIFQTRYNEAAQAVKEAVETGRLGRVLGARAILTWYRDDDYYRESDWKGTWDKEGGGVLIDQAIHTIDLMQWILGPPTQVEAHCRNVVHPALAVEDVAEAVFHFENGARACLYANNFYTYDADVLLEFHGEAGVAQIIKDVAHIRTGNETLVVEPTTDNPSLGKGYWGLKHRTQIQDFYRAVLAGEDPAIDGWEGLRALEIVLALYESARLGKPVDFTAASRR
ncbi:MAG: Gfo/Idh/MocA family protein, partial [Chitinophagales bacterium]